MVQVVLSDRQALSLAELALAWHLVRQLARLEQLVFLEQLEQQARLVPELVQVRVQAQELEPVLVRQPVLVLVPERLIRQQARLVPELVQVPQLALELQLPVLVPQLRAQGLPEG